MDNNTHIIPMSWRHIATALLICLTVFITHYKSPIFTSYDSRYSIHVTESLLKERNIDLDEYEFAKSREDYALFFYNDHAYSVYPIMTSIMAIPFVIALDKKYVDRSIFYRVCEKATAAAIVSLTSTIVFFTVWVATGSYRTSTLLLICFAYSTSAWSTASRGLWSHGPSMLLISAIVFVLLYSRQAHKPNLIPYVGILTALTYIARPTNAAIVLLLSAYIFFCYRGQFIRFILNGLCIAVLFACFNKLLYGIILLPYYVFPFGINRELLSPWLLKVAVINPDMTEAFWGNLISPNRGLFVFSPIFLFCFAGLILKIRERSFNALDLLMAGIAVCHLILISKTLKYWWGGCSFGPRYFTDILPVLIYFLIPVGMYITDKDGSLVMKITISILFLICMFFGIFVHYRGATNEAVWKWNSSEPLLDWEHGNTDHIDWHPERVWDYKDLQFFRGLKPK